MKKTLLIVDDTPDITFTLKKLFEESNEEYEVIISESGEDCLKLIKGVRLYPEKTQNPSK